MNSDHPKVSICIPVYNGMPLVETTIRSVLAQTRGDYEIVIRDDRSTDGTWEYLKEHFGKDQRFRLYRNERNVEIGEQYNRLFRDARGDILLKLDADDLLHPQLLEKGLEILDRKEADVVVAGWEHLQSDGSTSTPRFHRSLSNGVVQGALLLVLIENPFHLCFTLFRRDLLPKTLRDGLHVLHTETCDWEFMLRLAMAGGRFFCIDEILGQYRLHRDNRSRKPNAQFESALRDVLSYWYEDLERICGGRVLRQLVLDMMLGHASAVLRGNAPLCLRGLEAGLRLLAGWPRHPDAAVGLHSATHQ